jgi:hypothetical protein
MARWFAICAALEHPEQEYTRGNGSEFVILLGFNWYGLFFLINPDSSGKYTN